MASLAAMSAIRLRKNDASSRPSSTPSQASHQLEEVRELRAVLETTQDQLKIENARRKKNEDGTNGRAGLWDTVYGIN